MRITVLGKSPSWQDVDGACSGYLVEDAEVAMLIDCGNGVFSKLRRFRDYLEIDAVVISHLHADHFLDLVPYSYALTLGPRQQAAASARPRLIAPAGARETFRRVVGAWGDQTLIEDAFEIEEYSPDSRLEVGPIRLRFQQVPHFTESFAIDVGSANDAGRFTFGADCGPTEQLVEIARDTDLLLVEATLSEPEEGEVRGHMTPAEAGAHGRRAAARRVVLTHMSDELDADRAREEASKAFGAPVELAREGAVYEV